MGTNDDPFKFPDKLLDMTDLAEYLGAKYGGWYPVTRKYGMLRDRWIALPQGSPIGTFNYRVSAMRAAGFEEFPKDTAGFLKLVPGAQESGKTPGLRARPRHGGRQRLDPLVLVGPRRQNGRRQQQRRPRLPRDRRRP